MAEWHEHKLGWAFAFSLLSFVELFVFDMDRGNKRKSFGFWRLEVTGGEEVGKELGFFVVVVHF
jgi:hypothetical protein